MHDRKMSQLVQWIKGRACVLPEWMVFNCGNEGQRVSWEVLMILILLCQAREALAQAFRIECRVNATLNVPPCDA